jgi:hypothetical protein
MLGQLLQKTELGDDLGYSGLEHGFSGNGSRDVLGLLDPHHVRHAGLVQILVDLFEMCCILGLNQCTMSEKSELKP